MGDSIEATTSNPARALVSGCVLSCQLLCIMRTPLHLDRTLPPPGCWKRTVTVGNNIGSVRPSRHTSVSVASHAAASPTRLSSRARTLESSCRVPKEQQRWSRLRTGVLISPGAGPRQHGCGPLDLCLYGFSRMGGKHHHRIILAAVLVALTGADAATIVGLARPLPSIPFLLGAHPRELRRDLLDAPAPIARGQTPGVIRAGQLFARAREVKRRARDARLIARPRPALLVASGEGRIVFQGVARHLWIGPVRGSLGDQR